VRFKQDLEQDIRQRRSAVLLINLLSRRGRRLGPRAQNLLERNGFSFSQVHLVTTREQLPKAIEQALAARPTLLIVGGGDGTVSHIAARLAYQDTVLGLLPFGTTNNFARNLGIPAGLAAVNVIANGKVADIDLGKAGSSYFANVAGIGLSADVAAGVSLERKLRLGRTAYMLTGLRRLWSHRSFTADVEVDGESVRLYTHQVVVANGAFHGGTLIGHDVTIDDERLEAFWFGSAGRLGFIRDLGLFMFARGRTRRRLNFRSATIVRIVTEPQVPVELDGELAGATPVEISMAAEALKIMVPLGFQDD
jgi:YegS/Rv2252/BmrU family lipid kinase